MKRFNKYIFLILLLFFFVVSEDTKGKEVSDRVFEEDELEAEIQSCFDLIQFRETQNLLVPDEKKFVVLKGEHEYFPEKAINEINEKLSWLNKHTDVKFYVLLHDYFIDRKNVLAYQKVLESVFKESAFSNNTILLTINVNQRLERGELVVGLSGRPVKNPDYYVTRPLFGMCRGILFDKSYSGELKDLVLKYFPAADTEMDYFWKTHGKLSEDKIKGIVHGLYKKIPKPLTIYSYSLNYVGEIRKAIIKLPAASGKDNIVEFRFTMQKTNEDGDWYRAQPIQSLREDQIEKYSDQYVISQAFWQYGKTVYYGKPEDRKKGIMPVTPPASVFVEGYVTDLSVSSMIDAQSFALSFVGLDFIPEFVGFVYDLSRGEWSSAGVRAGFTFVPFVTAATVKATLVIFAVPEEVVNDLLKYLKIFKKADVPDKATIQILDEYFLKYINELDNVKQAEFFKDLVGNPSMLELVTKNPEIIRVWEIWRVRPILRKDSKVLEATAKLLPKLNEKFTIDHLNNIIKYNVLAGNSGHAYLKSMDLFLGDLEYFVDNYKEVDGFTEVIKTLGNTNTDNITGASFLLRVLKDKPAELKGTITKFDAKFYEDAADGLFKFDIKAEIGREIYYYELKSWKQAVSFNTGQFVAYLDNIETLENLKYFFHKRDLVNSIEDIKSIIINGLKKDKSKLLPLFKKGRLNELIPGIESIEEFILKMEDPNIFNKIFNIY